MEKNTFNSKRWIQIALINFCVVALAGVTLRYKINFPLPAVNQKYLLHAHSHFAFDGWVAIALMACMVNYLQRNNVITNYTKYRWILIGSCLTAYAMFISFIIEGYDFFSITFSSLSIFISYFFIFYMWRDLNKVVDKAYSPFWFKGALVLLGMSSIGAFSLAYLMANNILIQDLYFAAIYFFLHFQYNGWFLFACFGLLFSFLYKIGFLPTAAISKKLFVIMAIMVGPTFLLSILWLKLPASLRWIANISGILQLLTLVYFIQLLPVIKKHIKNRISKTTRLLWIMACAAFILKIILQMLSIIPFLSHLAFGFRPVVIGYLHLSFIGIISLFILGYVNEVYKKEGYRVKGGGLILFVFGFLVQEILLMAQGLEALEVEPLPYANIILFICAVLMFFGLIWIAVGISRKRIQSSL
ncbi:MAG: hypothetical protein ABI123_01720 [Ginsengibacter sp.]|jgi:hypothetical protein